MNSQRMGIVKKISAMALILMTILMFLPCTVPASTGSLRIVNQGDTPTKPTSLSAQVKINATNKKYVFLSWGASIDKCSGVKEYKIYRNGISIGTSMNTYYSDYKVDSDGRYIYKVVAVDRKNHVSKPAESKLITVNNQAQKKQNKQIIQIKQNISKNQKSSTEKLKTLSYTKSPAVKTYSSSLFIFNADGITKSLNNIFSFSSVNTKLNTSSTKTMLKSTLNKANSYGSKIKNYLGSIFNQKSNTPTDMNLSEAVDFAIKNRGLK